MTQTNKIERDKLIQTAAFWIQSADALVITAGAGMGVDSGLPDFRGNKGFWKAYPPFAKLGYSFIDMANPNWFSRDPQLAWGFYGHRMNLYRKTIPHKGFHILKKWGQQKTGGYFVFTSNVDGQFQKAGFSTDQISECHGSIHHMQCARPCRDLIWDGQNVEVKVNEETMKAGDPLPLCPNCGQVARPNILMFGDWNWIGDRSDMQQRAMNQWFRDNASSDIVIIECGAGTGVPTVRMTSERIAARGGAKLIRVNTREPEVPAGHIGLDMGALEALEAIDKIYAAKHH
jgi:NAD-dependent SIR2 family protein deacetylase